MKKEKNFAALLLKVILKQPFFEVKIVFFLTQP